MGITRKTKEKTTPCITGHILSHCYQDTRVFARNKLMRSSWLKSSLISRVQERDNTLMYYTPQGVVFLRGHNWTGTVQMCVSNMDSGIEHTLSKGC